MKVRPGTTRTQVHVHLFFPMCFELLTDKNFQGEDFLKCSDLHVDKETLFPLLKSDSSL